jgi:hypothetical protein
VLPPTDILGRRDPNRGLRVRAAAYAIRARSGGEFAPFFRARTEPVRIAATTAVGAQAARLWAEGSRLTLATWVRERIQW